MIASGIVGAFFGVAAAWVVVGYVKHWNTSRPHDAGAFTVYAKTALVEWWATLRTWLVFATGIRKSGPWQALVPEAGPPIALVHGYMMNRSSMAWIARALRKRGFANLVLLDPRPIFAPLETQADWLADEVRRISAHCGGADVVLVAHSQGGLLSRIAAQRHPTLPLKQIFTIGSPHLGTLMATRSRTPNGVQMRYQSSFLQALTPPVVPLCSIYSDMDNIVFPKETSRLGESVELHGVGHHALCFSDVVVDAIVRRL